jgi:hypothetical protein
MSLRLSHLIDGHARTASGGAWLEGIEPATGPPRAGCPDGTCAVRDADPASDGDPACGDGGAASAQQNDGGGTGEGESATCTYAGKSYSEGSKVKQDDGNIYRCTDRGTWILALTTPPGGVKGQVRPVGGLGVFQAAP